MRFFSFGMLREWRRLTEFSITTTGSISLILFPRACRIEVGFELSAKKTHAVRPTGELFEFGAFDSAAGDMGYQE